MTGVKSDKKARMAINYLFTLIQNFNLFQVEMPKSDAHNIVLISDYDIGFELKRSVLHQVQ